MRAWSPEECLIGLEHDEWGRALSDATAYRCPYCGAATHFNVGEKEPASFPLEVREAFRRAGARIRLEEPYEKDYCDLSCACGVPVRIVYGNHEFAMSCYRREPRVVLVYGLPGRESTARNG